MGSKMKRICTVCARGGSKGIKNKNIRELGGRPLIAHTIAKAKASGLFDVIAVSSDSEEILRIGREWGADVAIRRPDELASDTAGKIPTIVHCVETAEAYLSEKFDTVVDLDATSPLRSIEDIKGVIDLLESSDATNVVSAMPSRRSPYFNLVELDSSGYVILSKPPPSPIFRRQDSPKCFDLNASIFAWQRSVIATSPTVLNQKTRLFVMPEERSIDIDSELDFEFVEFLLQKELIKGPEMLKI